jgi:hypothetical protein
MDNVQKRNICTNVPSSQTFRSTKKREEIEGSKEERKERRKSEIKK